MSAICISVVIILQVSALLPERGILVKLGCKKDDEGVQLDKKLKEAEEETVSLIRAEREEAKESPTSSTQSQPSHGVIVVTTKRQAKSRRRTQDDDD